MRALYVQHFNLRHAPLRTTTPRRVVVKGLRVRESALRSARNLYVNLRFALPYPSVAAFQARDGRRFLVEFTAKQAGKVHYALFTYVSLQRLHRRGGFFPSTCRERVARVVGRHAKRGASALLGKIVREKREQTAPSSLPHQRPCMAEIMQIRVGVVLRGYARHSPCVSETRESQSFHARRLPTQRERETPSLFFSEALRFGGALSVASRKGNALPKERAEKARRRGNSVQVYQVELEGVSYIFLQWARTKPMTLLAQRHPLPGAHSRTCVAARGPP